MPLCLASPKLALNWAFPPSDGILKPAIMLIALRIYRSLLGY